LALFDMTYVVYTLNTPIQAVNAALAPLYVETDMAVWDAARGQRV
jgi:hypothetical protein